MFLLIHVETEPQTTNINFSRLENCVSQAVFSSAGKVLSNAPIHDISSKNTMVLPRFSFTAA